MSTKAEQDLSAAVMAYQKAYYEAKEEVGSLRTHLSEAEQEVARLRKVLGQDQTFSLHSVLKEFQAVANHLFDIHSCDHHGYEVWMQARDKAAYYQQCIMESLQSSGGVKGRTDRERLDWLENRQQGVFVFETPITHELNQEFRFEGFAVGFSDAPYPTVREAIDKAMEAASSDGKGTA